MTQLGRDVRDGLLPAAMLIVAATVSFLLREAYTGVALFLFHGAVAVFAGMTAWAIVGDRFNRGSIALASATALLFSADWTGLKPSIYAFLVAFSATFVYAWANTRTFKKGTESTVTLFRDWILALLAGTAMITLAVVAEFRIVLLTTFTLLALIALVRLISVLRRSHIRWRSP